MHVRRAEWSLEKRGLASLCLVKQTGGDVAHVFLFQLVVLAFVPIDADVLESSNDSGNVKAHGSKAIDELLVIATVTVSGVNSVDETMELRGQGRNIRSKLGSLGPLAFLLVLQPQGFFGDATATTSTSGAFTWSAFRSTSVLDGPIPSDMLKFTRVGD